MMTADEIKAKIGLDNINVREDGTSYWLSATRTIRKHRHSKSVRLDKDPSPAQIEAAIKAFDVWWMQEQEE